MCCKNRPEIGKYLKLYLVLETSMLKIPLHDFIPQVIDGGVTTIQLRDKKSNGRELYDKGVIIKELIKDRDILFVINDRLDIAKSLDVNNIHIGIKDIPIDIVRSKFPEMVIGYSCNSISDVNRAMESGADYIGTGPAFFTNTKDDLRPVIHPTGIKEIVSLCSLPAVAIGGITEKNILELKGCGLSGVAVSSAICSSEKPFNTSRYMRELAEML